MFGFLKSVLFLFFALGITSLSAKPLVIGEDEVAAAVKKEFAEQGVDEDIDFEFFGGQSFFKFDDASAAKIMISNLKYEEAQNKFSANVEIFADGKSAANSSLQGKYYILTEVYVPARDISKGEVLSENDLKKIKVRSNRIKSNVLVALEQLQEKEVKRFLKEGKLISEKEVGERILIHKGDVVTLLFRKGPMQITAKGEALSDGGKNQKVEAENTKSGKKVYGIVIDENTIEVNFQ